MTTTCAYCDADVGMYDFGRDCCLTRFLVHAQTKEIRNRYVAWLEAKVGKERIELVKREVEKAWAAKREAALNFGRAKI